MILLGVFFNIVNDFNPSLLHKTTKDTFHCFIIGHKYFDSLKYLL